MLGADIEAFFKGHPVLKKHYKGIYAREQVKSIRLRNRSLAIINTDSLSGDGKHWYCLSKLENRLGNKNLAR